MTVENELLTAQYVDSHMKDVQNYESFARTLVQMIMTEAREKITGTEKEVTVTMDFTVSKDLTAGCFKICPKKWFCIHIG